MNNRPSTTDMAKIEAAIKKRSRPIHPQEDYVHQDQHHHHINDITGYEYLNHTADIQLHSWGDDVSSSLGKLIQCMFGYMTCIELVDIDEEISLTVGKNIIAEGHDWHSLLYSFMNEWLFLFYSTGFIVKELQVVNIDRQR